MASLQKQRTGTYHVVLFHDGKRYKRTLSTKKHSLALAKKAEIEETQDLVRRGRLVVPDGHSAVEFIVSAGRPEPKLSSAASAAGAKPEAVENSGSSSDELDEITCLGHLLGEFMDSIPDGAIELNTRKQIETHHRHLLRVLGGDCTLKEIGTKKLQSYINQRATEHSQKILDKSVPKNKRVRLNVSAATIKKEIVSLRSAWSWAQSMEYVARSLPRKGLRWPKIDQKPPFQTWDEIERQIDRGGLATHEIAALWGCLYLRVEEIEELLTYVRNHQIRDYVHPFMVMAAYTGARRSELLRSRPADFDFAQKVVTIRELKRVKGQRTTRRVPLCDSLIQVMEDWLRRAPRTPWTFFDRSPSGEVKQVSPHQIQNQLKSTLRHSRWQPITGWHCFRHSFISNLASAGVDQRLIDDFVGHTTEQMRRRYRHLLPDVKQAALNQVFGTGIGLENTRFLSG